MRKKSFPMISGYGVVIYCFLIVYAIIILYPLLWIFITSLKSNLDMFTSTWSLPSPVRWTNYMKAINAGMIRYIWNSVIVTVASVGVIVVLGAFAGYAFARLSFKGSIVLFLVLISGYMIPPHATLVPLYWIFKWMRLLDTYWALILSYIGFGLPFSILLLRAYFFSIPREIEEAAEIDGCGVFSTFYRIIFPMSRTALSAVAIFQGVFVWNEFLFALTFINREARKTLPVGLASLQGRYITDWTTTVAGVILGTIPLFVLYLVLQKQFVKGMTATLIKG